MKEKNILVVEDDLHMRVFITTVLETSGYHATATKDGQEGIRKVNANQKIDSITALEQNRWKK